MPKTKFIPRVPWDRAPLSKMETAVYDFIRRRVAEGHRVPGKRSVMRELNCTEVAAYGTLRNLVYKGWLGEGGDAHANLYINDKPDDLDD